MFESFNLKDANTVIGRCQEEKRAGKRTFRKHFTCSPQPFLFWLMADAITEVMSLKGNGVVWCVVARFRVSCYDDCSPRSVNGQQRRECAGIRQCADPDEVSVYCRPTLYLLLLIPQGNVPEDGEPDRKRVLEEEGVEERHRCANSTPVCVLKHTNGREIY